MLDFQSDDYKSALQEQLNESDDTLILARGRYIPDKKQMGKQIAQTLGKEVRELNLDELITKDEPASIARLKFAFEEADADREILYVTRGDRLNGVYTGHTLSITRYTSPQERAFLQLVDEFDSPVIVNIELRDNVDETLQRKADLSVNCKLPSNPIKRVVYKLKNYTLHGIDLSSNYRTNATFASRLN
ncbi:MAG: hypothetical protein ACQETE_12230 [Bacteroidota bacterium]